jgi:hypothetical protein
LHIGASCPYFIAIGCKYVAYVFLFFEAVCGEFCDESVKQMVQALGCKIEASEIEFHLFGALR